MTAIPDSIEFLQAVHARLAAHGLVDAKAELILSPYEAVFPRRPSYLRRHFRVEAGGQIICHLIVGANLAPVHQRAEKFFLACPKLICRPLLFWEEPDGTGHLCLEHFAGESLDDAVLGGRSSPAQWLSSVRLAQGLLAQTEQPSSPAALEREIKDLVGQACDFPGLSLIDTLLLRELAGSVLLAKAPAEGRSTRWSNGDFIGRNLLINPSGEVRLIDYEHASPTLFWASDWLRLIRISNLPPGLDQKSVPELSLEHQSWHEVHLWLQNLAQLREAEPSESVMRYTTSVIRLLFEAIGRLAGNDLSDRHRSFLLDTLGGHRPNQTGAWARNADRKTLESILTADLEHAQYRLLTIRRQLLLQEAMYRSEQDARETQRSARESLQGETSRLQRDLHRAQQHIDRCLDDPDRRAANCQFGLDQPKPLGAADGKLSLSGWIIDRTPTERRVRLRLDGGQLYDCQTGLTRPDVAATFPDDPGSLVSGFSLQTLLPAGFHVGTIEQCKDLGDWTAVGSVSFWAGVCPVMARLEISVPPSRPAGDCPIHGWCVHPQADIETLSVRFGTTIAALNYGLPRPDVAASYPGIRGAERSGFSGIIPLGSGRNDLILIAALRDGTRVETVIARDISVPNAALERATLDLFVPEPPAQTTESNIIYQLNSPLHFGHSRIIHSFLDGGWSEPQGGFRWAIGLRAGLKFIFSSAVKPRQLRLRLFPFLVAGKVDRQRINIDFPSNAAPDVIELTQDIHQEVIIELPATASDSEVFHIQFGFPDACRPKDLGLSEDTRLLSVGFLELTLS